MSDVLCKDCVYGKYDKKWKCVLMEKPSGNASDCNIFWPIREEV